MFRNNVTWLIAEEMSFIALLILKEKCIQSKDVNFKHETIQ